MKNFLRAFFVSVCTFLLCQDTKAQGTIPKGSIAFTGFSMGTNCSFAFIIIKSLPAGETLYFTDQGWAGAGWTTTPETHMKWVIPAGMTAGKVIVVKTEAGVFGVTNTTGLNIEPGYGMMQLLDGDQIIAYQSISGPEPASPEFIAAAHFDNNYLNNNPTTHWNNTATGPDESVLPTGLTPGENSAAPFSTFQAQAPIYTYELPIDGGSGEYVRYFINTHTWANAATAYPLTYLNWYPNKLGWAVVSADAAGSIGSKTASVGGNVLSEGEAPVTERGFVWAIGGAVPTISSNKMPNGAGGGSFSKVEAGFPAGTYITYRTYAINTYGTTYSAVYGFNTNAALSADIINKLDIACNAGSTGEATAAGSGGLPPYAYQWNNGATTAKMAGVVAGRYSVVVTDAEGSSFMVPEFILWQQSAIRTAPSLANVTCNGARDGVVGVQVSGGVRPYSYAWAPYGGASFIAAGLSGGSFKCTITDINGCIFVSPAIVVAEPTALTASATKTDILCKNLATGSAKASAGGGTPPYTYSWAPSGGNAAIATGLPAGSYTCTITDKNLCKTTTTVMIAEPAGMAGIVSQVNVFCAGNATGSATVNVTGGTGSYTYLWSDGQTAATAIGLLAGTYTCTIKDGNNCRLIPTFTVTEPPILNAVATQTNVSCFNGSDGEAGVVVTGGTAPYIYAWTSSGSTSATAAGLTVGTYTCTVTDAKGCTFTQSFTITAPAVLSVNTSHTNILCNGENTGTATLTVTGGTPVYTYTWAPSGGNAAIATGLISDNYSCVITDAKGCNIQAAVTITEPPELTASATQTNVSCNQGADGTATVSASGGTAGYTYDWAPSGGNAATATGLLAGIYTCTIKDANGCIVVSSVTITEPTALTTTPSQTNVTCKGANDGIAAVSVTGGSGAYIYAWLPSGGTNATATGLAPGNFTCTITDANGCSITENFTITEPALITVTAASQHNITCNGTATGNATVNATGGTPGYSYLWAPSGGTAATAINLAAGIYTCTVTDANGCTGALSFTLTEPTALAATISKTDATITGGNDGTASVNVTGGTGAYSYNWSPSGNNIAVATNLVAGNYICVIKDGNNCQISKNITLLEPAAVGSFPALFNNYGDAAYILTNPASNSTGAFSYTSSDNSVATITGNTLTVLTPGTTTITATQAPDANYNAASVSSLLTVSPKDITVILTDVPVISKQYDGDVTATVATANYQLQGILGNDNVAVNAGIVQYNNKNAGTGKTVTATNFVLSGAQQSYYNLVTITADAIGAITAKSITVNVMPVTKVYDGTTAANVTFNPVSAADGLIGTDDLSVRYTAAAFDNKNTGTGKSLNFTGISFAGTDKDNYILQPFTATGSITVKPITVTANAAQVKVYGARDPEFTYTITNGGPLASGDSFAGSLMRDPGENVGTYPINVGTLSAGNNYLLTYAGAAFVVTPQGLIITAENKDIYEGDALPTLTPLYNGFVNGETVTVLTTQPVVTTTATAGSPAGNYPINVSGAAAANYNISYEDGMLNIKSSIPTAINFATTALLENSPAGSSAGVLSAVSGKPGETFSYSLVPGTGAADNALFTISGNNILTAVTFNYEQQSMYVIRVRATTSYNTWLEKELRITVSDVNEQPIVGAVADQVICFSTVTQIMAVESITPGPEQQQAVTLRVSADRDVFSLLEIVSTGVNTANIRYALKQGVTGEVVVKITVKDNGGITNGGIDQAERSFKITVNDLPVFSIQSSKPSPVSKGDVVMLSATGNAAQYLWSEAAGIPAGTQGATVTVKPVQTTTYTVTGVSGDCTAEQSYTIQVVENFNLDATNVVTPNGDGINDKWVIRNIESYPLNVVKIFDRSGRLMYTKSGYLNEWDGTVNGKPLAEGTYYYAIDLGNGKKVFKGFITIIR